MTSGRTSPTGKDVPAAEARRRAPSEKEIFQLLIENVRDYAVIVLDEEGHVAAWNTGAEHVLLYSEQHIVGKHFAVFYTPEDIALGRPDRELNTARQTGNSIADNWIVRQDGTRFWASGVTTALRDGELCGFVKIVRDRTQWMLAQEKVEAESRRQRDLFMQAPAAIAVLAGPEHVFQLANPLYQQLTGRTDLIGKPGRIALPELVEKGVWDILDRVYAGGEPLIAEEFPAQPGRSSNSEADLRYFNFSAQPTRDLDGRVDGVFIHAVEVTDQVRARQKVEELAQQLDAERARLDFGQRAGGIGTFERNLVSNEVAYTPQLEKIYGFEPGAFGTSFEAWSRRVHPDDFDMVMGLARNGIAERRDIAVEYRIIAKDGSVRWVADKAVLLNAEDGTPDRLIGINIDITDRKQIELNLKFLSEASKLLSSSLDYETTLESVARLAVPQIGDWCSVDMLDAEEQLQQVVVAHKDPEKVAWARELRAANPPDMSESQGLPQVIRSGKSELYPFITDELLVASARNEEELELTRRLGLTSVIIVPIRRDDKPVGAITLVTTESRRRYTAADLAMAEELASRAALAVENAHLYREAQLAIVARNDFISIASHELKTPVTSLKVYAQVLRKQAEKGGDTNSVRYLSKMEGQVDKLTNLINDLLDVSKMEAGKLEYRVESFDARDLIQEVIDTARASSPRHAIVVAVDEPVVLQGDRERLGQIVTNLVTNAIKYSPRADRIEVGLSTTPDTARIAVRDFGIGIDAVQQARIFERFYQVTDPEERTFPGLGMGLYISREIARRHGGDIVVESCKGEGSTFTLLVPRQGADEGGASR